MWINLVFGGLVKEYSVIVSKKKEYSVILVVVSVNICIYTLDGIDE
jgi:hypothetical protein